MEKEFVSYEQAIALKELGIYIPPPCYSVYRKYNNIGASLLINAESMETIDLVALLKQQVFRWFRDKYDLYFTITDAEIYAGNQSGYRWRWMIFKPIVDVCISIDESLLGHLTYEEAENDCIDKLIELAKQYV